MNWIKAHFQRYRERTPWAFCWRITLESLVVTYAMAMIAVVLGKNDRDFSGIDPVFLLAYCVTGAPIIETLLFQAFPVWIARKCNARFSVQVLASFVPFFAGHAIEGAVPAIGAGLIGGFYFAFTYAHWRVQSKWTAFWTTALSHALHNGALIAISAIGVLCGNDPSSTVEKPAATNVAPALPPSSMPMKSPMAVISADSPPNPAIPPPALLPDGNSTTPPIPPLPGTMPAQPTPTTPALPAISPTPAPVAGSTYQIVKGDTLTGIAKKTGVSWSTTIISFKNFNCRHAH